MTHDPREALEELLRANEEVDRTTGERGCDARNAALARQEVAEQKAREALTASAPKGEPFAWYSPTDSAQPFVKPHIKEALLPDAGAHYSIPLYTSPPPAAGCPDWGQIVQSLLRSMDHLFKGESSSKQAERMADDLCKKYPALRREAPAPSGVAIELAYGLLWIVGCDRSTTNGNALYLARKALYERIDKDGQARGITAARKALADNPFHNLPDPVDTGVFPRTDGRPGDTGTGDGASGAVAAVRDDGDSAGAASATGLDRLDAVNESAEARLRIKTTDGFEVETLQSGRITKIISGPYSEAASTNGDEAKKSEGGTFTNCASCDMPRTCLDHGRCFGPSDPPDRREIVAEVKLIEMVSYANGYKEPADPIWRIEIDGYCADFPTETAANNFRTAILAALDGGR